MISTLLKFARDRLRNPAVVVKPSREAHKLALFLRQRHQLDAALANAVREIRLRMENDETPLSFAGKAKTVGEHFRAASSGSRKLSILAALVRRTKAETILEIGTGYGIGTAALATSQPRPDVVTIEGFEPQATLAPANLEGNAEGIEFIKGTKNDVLPRLTEEGRRFDLVFHDGGHTGDGYVNDFDTIYPMMSAGGVFALDDIGWDDGDNRQYTGSSRRTCREGWEEIVRDSRVKGAILYRGNLGILLL